MALTFDPKSAAGQRIATVSRTKAFVLWNLYGHTAFAIVTDDASAIALGHQALLSGRSGAEVARYLTEYLTLQEVRRKQAAKDKRNAAARARRAKKKGQGDGKTQ